MLNLPEKFDSYLLHFEDIMSLKWCILIPWTYSLCLYQKWTLQSAMPRHFCVQRDTDKGRTKAENLLQQSTASEMQATSGDQSRLSHPQGLPLVPDKMKR